jgi:probable rRNA maturation factor
LEVLVLNRQRAHRVGREELAAFLRRLVEAVPSEAADSVAVCLVSDRRMREYNMQFRQVDATTDVLSFGADPEEIAVGERHLGDVVISVPTAARQAVEAGHALDRELEVLVLHGYLHLLGYDHETDDGAMMHLQGRLAKRLVTSGGRP